MSEYSQIAGEGLWRNNPALVQLLGLCPLLAVSNSFVTALGLGLVTLVSVSYTHLTLPTIYSV